MRALLLLLPLAACHPAATPIVAAAAGTAASVAVFGRSPLDLAWSLASGRDCSIVRLDRGESYCRKPDPPPSAPRFCTRTLGVPECFENPELLPDHPSPLADTPVTPTAAQDSDHTTPHSRSRT